MLKCVLSSVFFFLGLPYVLQRGDRGRVKTQIITFQRIEVPYLYMIRFFPMPKYLLLLLFYQLLNNVLYRYKGYPFSFTKMKNDQSFLVQPTKKVWFINI